MGLPIWRDPEEQKAIKNAIKNDPTAAARSSIRRRPSVHGRRSTRPRLNRDQTVQPSRLERESMPHNAQSRLRESRRITMRTGVPPISTLLESADRHATLPPPPAVSESRNYYDEDAEAVAMEGELRSSIARLQETAGRLERQTEVMRERLQRREQRSRPQQSATGHSERTRSPPPQRLPESLRPITSGSSGGRVTLPTPPLDASDQESDSLFVPEVTAPPRRSHPLSNSWSADSVDGLGDRNRSPTPADGWEVMRTTITPDATLPSADSSFTSAVASQSFSSGNETTVAEAGGVASSASTSRRGSSEEDSASDSASSVDPDDLVCDDENTTTPTEMAHYMHDHEILSAEGRERIRVAREHFEHEGNRYTSPNESAVREIGFRLIDEALATDEGQERFVRARLRGEAARGSIDEAQYRASRYGRITQPRTRRAHITDEEPPSPDPGRYTERVREAVRETTAQVHDYFNRYTADALNMRTRSPPPRYEPRSSAPVAEPNISSAEALHNMLVETSNDEPQPHPVSPPTQRSQNEVADSLLSGDETDLAAMRRVVERLASRDDVPEEWWTSIGLNLSRTRFRVGGDRRLIQRNLDEAVRRSDAVRTGRVERRNSRL